MCPFGGSPLLVLRRHADEEPYRSRIYPFDAWQFNALMAKNPEARPLAAQAAGYSRDLAARYARSLCTTDDGAAAPLHFLLWRHHVASQLGRHDDPDRRRKQ